jgi:hypothetical protein
MYRTLDDAAFRRIVEGGKSLAMPVVGSSWRIVRI